MGRQGERKERKREGERERERGNEKDRRERRWKINLDKKKNNLGGAALWGMVPSPGRRKQPMVGIVIGLWAGGEGRQ